MSIAERIKPLAAKALKDLYGYNISTEDITINSTKPEFEGDYTMVLFSFVKQLKKSPEQLGKELGENLVTGNPDIFSTHNVIKGFLNLTIKDDYWLYVVFNCATEPQVYPIQNPARLGWQPIVKIEHYHVGANEILGANK